MLFYNSAADPEAKARAQFTLRGEEGLKDFGLIALGNAGSTVGNRHHRAGPAIGGQ
jgi:hypothetical protein